MSSAVNSELAQTVSEWIYEQANEMRLAVKVYAQNIVREGDWLNVSVWLNHGGDAYDRASLLQQIEDLWEPSAHDGLQLFLLPGKSEAPQNADLYTQITDLMDRQHQLLNIIDPNKIDEETAKQLLAVKQEWIETRNEAGRVLSAVRNS